MKLFVTSLSVQLKSLGPTIAIVSGILLVTPGCGIPQLRCAQRGAPLPQSYNLPYQNHDDAWSKEDGAASNIASTGDAGSVTQASSTDKAASNSKGLLGPFRFASVVKRANSLDLDEADKPVDQPSMPGMGDANSSDLGAGFSSNGAGNGQPGVDLGVYNLENSAQVPWCEFFNDPFLTGLINQAIFGNQELRILNEEIQIAANEVQARRGAYLPFFNFGAGAGLEKSSRFSRAGAVEDQLTAAPGQGFPDPLPNFLVATNITWEIDIWRRLRNARDAASLRYLGTADGRNYVVTRLVADIAENYYELLALDNRLTTLDTTIRLQEQSLEVAEAMKAAGRGTELAVQRFQAEVRKNQSEKLIIGQDIVEAENRINFLLGRYPQPIERLTVEYLDLQLQTLAAGVPSQLLRNRSDIRQAERELQAAGLDVKVARARFYPALVLNGGVGYQAFNPRYILNSPDSLIYNVAGDLVAPLINRKAIKADYLSANARQLQSVYEYQRTILNAVTEVVNYMNKVDNYGQSIAIKRQQLEALLASVDSATKLFQNARGEYLDVLLAQRDLQDAKMVIIDTKQQQLVATVNAYQSLGGGSALVRQN